MTINKDIRAIERDLKEGFKDVMKGFKRELISMTPVDTGDYQISWEHELDIRKLTFVSTTDIKYNLVIWRGRKFVNGRWYGSPQGWGLEGGYKFTRMWYDKLKDEINNI